VGDREEKTCPTHDRPGVEIVDCRIKRRAGRCRELSKTLYNERNGELKGNEIFRGTEGDPGDIWRDEYRGSNLPHRDRGTRTISEKLGIRVNLEGKGGGGNARQRQASKCHKYSEFARRPRVSS